MTFSKGSLILVDYTAKIKDTDKVFDTTIEEDAKEHSIHEQDIKYRPKLVSIDDVSYPVLKGLDEALAKMSVGDKLTVEVTPEKGFGERDSGKIRMIPIRKLGEDAEKVSVGDTIEIDDKMGIVRFIGSGRVQIDYNHRYAGKTILYDVSVLKSLESAQDKVDWILENRLPVDDYKVTFDLTDAEVKVAIPEELMRSDGLQIMKHFIQMDIFKFVPTLERVSFVETHINKTKKKESAENPEAAEKPASAENPEAAEKPASAENPEAAEKPGTA